MKNLAKAIFVFGMLNSAFLIFNCRQVAAWHPGQVGGQALKLGADARAVGLGEAFCAISDDVNAVYWNPSGLAQIEKREVSLTHMTELIGIRYFNLAYTQPIKYSTIGCDVFTLYSKESVKDDDGNTQDHFMNYNSYFTLAYARHITDKFSSGISLKTLYNQLYQYKSSNFMFDIAGLYEPMKNLKLGLNLQNIPTTAKFTDELESVPFNLKLGIAYFLFDKSVALATDINASIDAKPSIHTGLEYWIKNLLALRAGYKYGVERSLGKLFPFCAGLGFRVKSIRLDYAFAPHGALGNNTHLVSLGAQF